MRHPVARRSCSKSWASGTKVSDAESEYTFGARCITPRIILEISTSPIPLALYVYHLRSLSSYVHQSHCSLLHPAQARTGHDPRRDVRALAVLCRLRALRRVARHARGSVRGRGHCDPRGDGVGGVSVGDAKFRIWLLLGRTSIEKKATIRTCRTGWSRNIDGDRTAGEVPDE